MTHYYRNMTASSFRILHLFVNACLLCADLLEIGGKSTITGFADTCNSHIIADFKTLGLLLGMTSEDECYLLHLVIRIFCATLPSLPRFSTLDEAKRKSWEGMFCENILHNILSLKNIFFIL